VHLGQLCEAVGLASNATRHQAAHVDREIERGGWHLTARPNTSVALNELFETGRIAGTGDVHVEHVIHGLDLGTDRKRLALRAGLAQTRPIARRGGLATVSR